MGSDHAAEDGASGTPRDWTHEEDETLLDFLIANYEHDGKKPEVAAKNIAWQNAGIEGRTPNECQARWKNLMGLVRNYRTTKEIAENLKNAVNNPTTYKSLRMKDAKSHPDFPKAPPSAYLLFFSDMRRKLVANDPGQKYTTTVLAKTIGKAYKDMSLKKKEKYDAKAAAAKEEYAEKLTQFYRDHPLFRGLDNEREAVPSRPVTPFFMFLKNRLEDGDDYEDEEQVPAELKAELKDEFANLSPKRKAKYVKKALAYEAGYADQLAVYCAMQSGLKKKPIFKQICTKDELKLVEKETGKPEKPAISAYAAFMKEQRESGDLESSKSKENMHEFAKRCKKVNVYDKAKYAMEVASRKMEYAEKLAEWKASVQEALHKSKPLTWDSVQTRGIYLYAADTLTAYRKKCPTLYEVELRNLIVQDYQKLSEDKRKEYEVRANISSSWRKRRGRDKTLLFKNEPERVPRSGYELFVKECLSKDKGKKAMKDLKPIWNALSKADQENFEHRCDDMKREYSKKFKEFVDGLSAVELAEFKRVRGPDAPNGSPERREAHDAVEDVEASSPEDAFLEEEGKDSDDEDDEDSPPALKYGVDQPKQLDEPLTSNGTANNKPSQQRKRKPSSKSTSSGEDEEEDIFAAKKLKPAAHLVASPPVESASKRKNCPSPSSSSDSDSGGEEQSVSKIKTEVVSPQKKQTKRSSDDLDADSEDDGMLVAAARSVLDVSMMEGSQSSQSPLVKPSSKPTRSRKKKLETDEGNSGEGEPEPPKSLLKSAAKKGSTASPVKPGPAPTKKPTSAKKEESGSEDGDEDEEEPPQEPIPAKSTPKPPQVLTASWRRTAENKGSSKDDEKSLQKSSSAPKSSTQKALASKKKSARKEDTHEEEEEEPPKSDKKSSRKQEIAREEPAVTGKAKKKKAGRNAGPAEEGRVTSEKEPTAGKKRKIEQIVEEEKPVATKKNKRETAITSTPMLVEGPKKKKKKKKKDKAGIAERN